MKFGYFGPLSTTPHQNMGKNPAWIMFCLLTALLPALCIPVSGAAGDMDPTGHDSTPLDLTTKERAQQITAHAVEAFNQGQFDQALQMLQQSLGVDEAVYETHYWIGRVHAIKAGSSATEQEQAVQHFRRALELQPYGEDGDLVRGWLSRFEGRPKAIGLMSVHPSSLTEFVPGATASVVQQLAALAKDSHVVIPHTQTGVIDLDKTSTDQLAEMCYDSKGILETGWLLGVAVEKLDGSDSHAAVWIFDPLAKRLYEPIPFTTSFKIHIDFKSKKANTTGNATLDYLSADIWQRCLPTLDSNTESKILDEVQFPTALDGIYARSVASYQKAAKLPLVMVLPVITANKDLEDNTREIGLDLQQDLLEPGQLSLISTGNSRQVLQNKGIDPRTASDADLAQVAHSAGCRYVISLTLDDLDLKTQNYLLVTKVVAKLGITATLLDCDSVRRTLSKKYSKSASSTLVLNDGISSMLDKRASLMNEVIQNAANDLQQQITTP